MGVYQFAFKHFVYAGIANECQDGPVVLHNLISLRLYNKNVTPSHCAVHGLQTWIQFRLLFKASGFHGS